MKIIAFGASSSRNSINQQLAGYAASLVHGAEVEVLDLNDFEMPLFSEDREAEIGQMPLAKLFVEKLGSADAIVVSFAEHNGSYAAAYKNVFDWASRVQPEVFQHRPVVYLATSPGLGGAGSVLASAVGSAGFFAADVKGSLSVPSFHQTFDMDRGVLRDPELKNQLIAIMDDLKKAAQQANDQDIQEGDTESMYRLSQAL
ncbi:MAG: NAD(P)H-dependent oxidoreductase [Kangiella sp.]|nr:NAD(P)H-dependent oxidoreductase [Kangiella sp.]